MEIVCKWEVLALGLEKLHCMLHYNCLLFHCMLHYNCLLFLLSARKWKMKYEGMHLKKKKHSLIAKYEEVLRANFFSLLGWGAQW